MGDQRVHCMEGGAVADGPATLLAGDQAGGRQFLQLERQGRAWQLQRRGDVPCQAPAATRLHQQTEDREADGVAKRGQRSRCGFNFSMLPEQSNFQDSDKAFDLCCLISLSPAGPIAMVACGAPANGHVPRAAQFLYSAVQRLG